MRSTSNEFYWKLLLEISLLLTITFVFLAQSQRVRSQRKFAAWCTHPFCKYFFLCFVDIAANNGKAKAEKFKDQVLMAEVDIASNCSSWMFSWIYHERLLLSNFLNVFPGESEVDPKGSQWHRDKEICLSLPHILKSPSIKVDSSFGFIEYEYEISKHLFAPSVSRELASFLTTSHVRWRKAITTHSERETKERIT